MTSKSVFMCLSFFMLLILITRASPQRSTQRISAVQENEFLTSSADDLNAGKNRSSSYYERPEVTGVKADNLAFPVEDTNKNRTATHSRKPLVDVHKCPLEGELLYPGDNEMDWVCDCKPSYLFYPAHHRCYAAYTQGPCRYDEILISNDKNGTPLCVRNECRRDTVFFNNNCFPLNQEDGCLPYKNLIGRQVFLVVNPTTLQLACLDNDDKYVCSNNCCKGSQREQIGKCS